MLVLRVNANKKVACKTVYEIVFSGFISGLHDTECAPWYGVFMSMRPLPLTILFTFLVSLLLLLPLPEIF